MSLRPLDTRRSHIVGFRYRVRLLLASVDNLGTRPRDHNRRLSPTKPAALSTPAPPSWRCGMYIPPERRCCNLLNLPPIDPLPVKRRLYSIRRATFEGDPPRRAAFLRRSRRIFIRRP